MESSKIVLSVLTILHTGQQRRHGHKEHILDIVMEGEGGMI